MEALLNRYRSLTVLLVVVLAQLIAVAYQVKTNKDDRLLRVWAVTAVTPMAGMVEGLRQNTIGFLEDYFILLDVRAQNRQLKAANDKLRMENVYFRNQLATAEHAQALLLFQARTPSKTVAARVIGNSTVSTAKAVFIDRGSTSGIERGMAVVTPEGVVGKVSAVYPLVAQVLLVTDPTFNVGIESQKGHVHGVLNCGTGSCSVEQIQNEDKVDVGEWFFTSGEDRIFPKGFPVGTVLSVQTGQGTKDVKLNLSGSPAGSDEVLVVLEGVHQPIPTDPPADLSAKMLPPPPPETGAAAPVAAKPETEADKVLQKYDEIGKQQNHVYGGYGSNLPDFNANSEPAVRQAATATSSASPPEVKPSTSVAAAVPSKGDQTHSAAASSGPVILGARPGTGSVNSTATLAPPSHPATAPHPVTAPETSTAPPLLGAPRHPATRSTTTDTRTGDTPER